MSEYADSQEWRRMLAGELYDPYDPGLVEARRRARRLCYELNNLHSDQLHQRAPILTELFQAPVSGIEIEPPFYCDYGTNIRFGNGVFLNFGCVLLDCAPITLGDRVLCGPGVHMYAATHPVDAATRTTGRELARPVVIGDDVWIGGGAIICPGATVGAGTTIGAGSVVTKSIPAHVVAAGNPCRVIRVLDDSSEPRGE